MFNCQYDSDNDVLYILKANTVVTCGDMDTHGLIFRYETEGSLEPCGVTIIGLRAGMRAGKWSTNRSLLASLISDRLGISPEAATSMLSSVPDRYLFYQGHQMNNSIVTDQVISNCFPFIEGWNHGDADVARYRKVLETYERIREGTTPPLVALDSWGETSAELKAVSYEMDVIHERYRGKENLSEREELLKPLRAKCIEIGERRQALVTT